MSIEKVKIDDYNTLSESTIYSLADKLNEVIDKLKEFDKDIEDLRWFIHKFRTRIA